MPGPVIGGIYPAPFTGGAFQRSQVFLDIDLTEQVHFTARTFHDLSVEFSPAHPDLSSIPGTGALKKHFVSVLVAASRADPYLSELSR